MDNRRKLVFLSLLTAGLGGLAGLALVELGMRVLGIEYLRPDYAVFDADRGWRHPPGLDFRWREEGDSWVRTNGEGYRDADRRREKDAGTFRIAVLGDSMTAAFEVDVRKSFPAVLEDGLNAKEGARRAEVLNFGVRAYGTLQEWMTFNKHAKAYSPDVVLLAFFSNDLAENSKELGGDPDFPYLVERGGEWAVEKDFSRSRYRAKSESRRVALKEWLRSRCRVYQLLSHLKLMLTHPEHFVRVTGKLSPDKPLEAALGVTAGRAAAARGPDPGEARAWAVTERILRMLKRDVEAGGAELAVLFVPDPGQAFPDARARREYSERLGTRSPDRIERELGRACARLGIRFLSYTRAFQSAADANKRCHHGFSNSVLCGGHLNVAGHRLLGELLSADIY